MVCYHSAIVYDHNRREGDGASDEVWSRIAAAMGYVPRGQLAVSLHNSGRVRDEDLGHLRKLGNVRILYLENTRVTDAGMEHLVALSGLEFVDLNGTAVTNRGLLRLAEGISSLKMVVVTRTMVTKRGVARCLQLAPGCIFVYSSRDVRGQTVYAGLAGQGTAGQASVP